MKRQKKKCNCNEDPCLFCIVAMHHLTAQLIALHQTVCSWEMPSQVHVISSWHRAQHIFRSAAQINTTTRAYWSCVHNVLWNQAARVQHLSSRLSRFPLSKYCCTMIKNWVRMIPWSLWQQAKHSTLKLQMSEQELSLTPRNTGNINM